MRFNLKDLTSKGFVEVDGKFYPPGSHQAVSKIVRKKVRTGNKKRESGKKSAKSETKPDVFVTFVKQELGIDLQQEYQFHAERKFRFDYACPELKIAVEQEGGIWLKGGGAHSRPQNILRDMEKYNLATSMGWKILRRTPDQLFQSETIELLTKTLAI